MPNYQKLPREFYLHPTLDVAQGLLNKFLIHNSPEGITNGKIVETEAYLGATDQASHAWRGRRTKRNEVLYGPPGHAYIYLIYGMYFCLNIVTQSIEIPECVLIRALEPVEGQESMVQRRHMVQITPRNVRNLTNGPGKLCMAMGIDKSLYGTDLCGEVLLIAEVPNALVPEIIQTPRIGVDYAGEAREYPWRFFIRDNFFVSKRAKTNALV